MPVAVRLCSYFYVCPRARRQQAYCHCCNLSPRHCNNFRLFHMENIQRHNFISTRSEVALVLLTQLTMATPIRSTRRCCRLIHTLKEKFEWLYGKKEKRRRKNDKKKLTSQPKHIMCGICISIRVSIFKNTNIYYVCISQQKFLHQKHLYVCTYVCMLLFKQFYCEHAIFLYKIYLIFFTFLKNRTQ